MSHTIYVSKKKFFHTIFETFSFDKYKLHQQLSRDFDRTALFINEQRIESLEKFYFILEHLPYTDKIKKVLWGLPTQVSFGDFMFILHKKYDKFGYVVGEVDSGSIYTNTFTINIDLTKISKITINFEKNFRLVDPNNDMKTISYIPTKTTIILGNSDQILFEWREIINNIK
jgi:hypothetical protein